MARPVKTLREAARDLTLMSDDGSEYEHNDGCQGEPECPACWVEGIRQLFIDFPEPRPVEELVGVLTDPEWGKTPSRIKADALREAAQAQRQLAADARTNNGKAEHTDIADWLDDRAAALEPRLEGAHP
jgi:hypothetical protein